MRVKVAGMLGVWLLVAVPALAGCASMPECEKLSKSALASQILDKSPISSVVTRLDPPSQAKLRAFITDQIPEIGLIACIDATAERRACGGEGPRDTSGTKDCFAFVGAPSARIEGGFGRVVTIRLGPAAAPFAQGELRFDPKLVGLTTERNCRPPKCRDDKISATMVLVLNGMLSSPTVGSISVKDYEISLGRVSQTAGK